VARGNEAALPSEAVCSGDPWFGPVEREFAAPWRVPYAEVLAEAYDGRTCPWCWTDAFAHSESRAARPASAHAARGAVIPAVLTR